MQKPQITEQRWVYEPTEIDLPPLSRTVFTEAGMQTDIKITSKQSEIHVPLKTRLTFDQTRIGSDKRQAKAAISTFSWENHQAGSSTKTRQQTHQYAQQKFEEDSQHTQKPQPKSLKLLVRTKGEKPVT